MRRSAQSGTWAAMTWARRGNTRLRSVWGPAMAMAMASVSAAAQPLDPMAAAVAVAPAPDSLDQPLPGTHPGDPERGRALVADRRVGLCLLCHSGPFPDRALQGTLAPDLAGAGARWTPGQLRLRVADARRLNPQGLMPSYLRTEGLHRVGSAWQGQPLLQPQQIEDVVAYLATLK